MCVTLCASFRHEQCSTAVLGVHGDNVVPDVYGPPGVGCVYSRASIQSWTCQVILTFKAQNNATVVRQPPLGHVATCVVQHALN